MKKKQVNAFDYAGHICKALPKGVLLTTKNGEKFNSMAIGWGHIGVEWRRPVFVVYVRENRFTKGLLDQCGEFTVNIPLDEADSRIISTCGSNSGRDMDKIEALGLTLVDSDHVSIPGIKEMPLTLECRVIFQQEQNPALLPQDIQDTFYRQDENCCEPPHTAYYGEILGAYIIED